MIVTIFRKGLTLHHLDFLCGSTTGELYVVHLIASEGGSYIIDTGKLASVLRLFLHTARTLCVLCSRS